MTKLRLRFLRLLRFFAANPPPPAERPAHVADPPSVLRPPPSGLRPEGGHTTVRSPRTAASRRASPSCTIAAVGPSISSPAGALVGNCSGGFDRSAQPVDRPQPRWRERSFGHVRGVGWSLGPDFARTGDAGTGVITAGRWRANERCFSGFFGMSPRSLQQSRPGVAERGVGLFDPPTS